MQLRIMALGSLAAESVLLALDVSTVLHDGDSSLCLWCEDGGEERERVRTGAEQSVDQTLEDVSRCV